MKFTTCRKVVFNFAMCLMLGALLSACSVLDFIGLTSDKTKANHDLFAGVLDNGNFVVSQDGESWQLVSYLAESNTVWNQVMSFNRQLIAMGMNGEVGDSTDGINWRPVLNKDHRIWLYDMEYNNKQYVAVGMGGMIVATPDLKRWTIRQSPTKNWLNNIAYANGSFVAVGANGTIVRSIDKKARKWLLESSPTSEWLSDVEFLNESFFAVGANGTIIYSANGDGWQMIPPLTKHWLYSITSGNGYYLAVGEYATILRSSDGVTWKLLKTNLSNKYVLRSVIYADNKFWIGGSKGLIASSIDGESWTTHETNTARNIDSITHLDINK